MRKVLNGVNLVAVGAMWAFAVWAWPRLPDRIPLHFGVDGMPDRWGPPSLWNWFLIPVVVVLLNLAVAGAGIWIRRDPTKVNLPGGQSMESLPAAAQAAVQALLRSTLAVVQFMMNVVFVLVILAQYYAAMGASTQSLLGGVLFLGLLSGPVFIVVYFTRLQKALATR